MLACPCISVARGQDMLACCMRSTFADASTLGVVMGDVNIGCEAINEVKVSGSIGAVQNCDHYPKKPKFHADSRGGMVTGDYVFGGDTCLEAISGDPPPAARLGP